MSANIVTPICNLVNCMLKRNYFLFAKSNAFKNVAKTFYLGFKVFLIQKHLESKRDQVWQPLYSRSFLDIDDTDVQRFMKSEIQVSLIYSCGDVQYIMDTLDK